MTTLLLQQVKRSWPREIWREVPVVVAVSGGADSVALATALAEMRRADTTQAPLILAHFDHGLRPTSNLDAAWVQQLAHRWELPVVCECAAEPLNGDERSAREARYAFLRRTAGEAGARYLAVAHTADDQVETVLHRMLRGTGVRGLCGMPQWRRLSEMTTLVRPLLACRRADVLAYLRDKDQGWNEDESNQSPRYTRNRIRNDLLPRLEADHPQVRESLLGLADRASSACATLESQAGGVWERAVARWDDGDGGGESASSHARCDLDVQVLRGLGEAAMVALFQRVWFGLRLPEQGMDASAWLRLCRLAWAEADAPAETLPGDVRVSRASMWMVIRRERPKIGGHGRLP